MDVNVVVVCGVAWRNIHLNNIINQLYVCIDEQRNHMQTECFVLRLRCVWSCASPLHAIYSSSSSSTLGTTMAPVRRV